MNGRTRSSIVLAGVLLVALAPSILAQGYPIEESVGTWVLTVGQVNGTPCPVCKMTLTLPVPDDGTFPASASGNSNMVGPAGFGYGFWSQTAFRTVNFRFTEATLDGGYTTTSGTLILDSSKPTTGAGSGVMTTSTGVETSISFTAAKIAYPGQINIRTYPRYGDFAGNWVVALGADAGGACDGCTILLHADSVGLWALGGELLVDAPFAGSTGAVGLWAQTGRNEFSIVVDGLALGPGGVPAGRRHFEGKLHIDKSNPLQLKASGVGTLTVDPLGIEMSFSATATKLDAIP